MDNALDLYGRIGIGLGSYWSFKTSRTFVLYMELT